MSELLQDWVRAQADRRPDAPAVRLGDHRLTYGELERASNRLAHQLSAAGCEPGDRVGLLIPKSPAAVVAMLGVLKVGAIYVPLDTASPVARLAKILEQCDDRWLLGAGDTGVLADLLAAALPAPCARILRTGWLGGGAPPTVTPVMFGPEDLAVAPEGRVAPRTSPRDPAHILFTSGSTGVPKGVVITHSNVWHFVRWAVEYFGIGPSDRNSGHSPLHFDLSTFDIFGSFAAGAELVMIPPELNLLPHRLARLIREAELTQWFSVPSVLNYMAKFDAVKEGDFPSLRRLMWCGEVFPTPSLIHWMERLPHARFTNLYGPTEATIASSYYTIPECPASEDEVIPIGRACGGEELLVLDEHRRAVPAGEQGNLYIGGAGLSPGYWRDRERTQEVFTLRPRTANPEDRIYRTGDLAVMGEDGLVRFCGRSDNQVKSRGYRIELGEIETALHALGVLRECAVVAAPGVAFDAVICCAYVPLKGRRPAPSDMREALSHVLPSYMLPARWLELDALPATSNGKIDRRSLKERFVHEEVAAR
ncbi:MAG TPA: amino acid adenylation domain-containing protein [Gemmatimonadales bacterium]|jgi:amino acid adenylation domain-containing protein|nr:amino acid adenylation domain-containing protein [Gemmatimonadales bacterium]